jgi:hypothetical protein
MPKYIVDHSKLHFRHNLMLLYDFPHHSEAWICCSMQLDFLVVLQLSGHRRFLLREYFLVTHRHFLYCSMHQNDHDSSRWHHRRSQELFDGLQLPCKNCHNQFSNIFIVQVSGNLHLTHQRFHKVYKLFFRQYRFKSVE